MSEVPTTPPEKPVSTELVVPGIGEIVNLEDPRQVALAYDAILGLEGMLKQARYELRDALKYHSATWGGKTMHMDGVTAVLKGGVEKVYDVEKIEADLLEAGMPLERVRQVVRERCVKEVVFARAEEARKANPVYATIIETHTREVPKQPSVSITVSEVIP